MRQLFLVCAVLLGLPSAVQAQKTSDVEKSEQVMQQLVKMSEGPKIDLTKSKPEIQLKMDEDIDSIFKSCLDANPYSPFKDSDIRKHFDWEIRCSRVAEGIRVKLNLSDFHKYAKMSDKEFQDILAKDKFEMEIKSIEDQFKLDSLEAKDRSLSENERIKRDYNLCRSGLLPC